MCCNHFFIFYFFFFNDTATTEIYPLSLHDALPILLDGKEYLFEGVIKGEIIKEKRGDSGFGYDPIFKPEGYDRTFAELGNDIKNQISHRALAVQKLCEFLQS